MPVNFFSGSPLNRLSWLRPSHHFLHALLESASTRWTVFKNGQPLIASKPGPKDRSLALLTTEDVRALLGPKPYFAQGERDGDLADHDVHVLEAARMRGPGIVFLGLQESDEGKSDALPSSDFSAKSDAASVVAKIKGTAYFSLDVSKVNEKELDEVLQTSDAARSGVSLTFIDGRQAMGYMDYYYAAVYAEARAQVDWNARNKVGVDVIRKEPLIDIPSHQFCAACGSPVYSMWAGWKLSCSSLLPWADNTGREPCPTGVGLHNQVHPRTDPVVIMAVVNEENDKVLLGRNRKWPGKFYSAMAGFVEPGEAFEDAVKRELWEEAGIRVWGIQYHSAQPWPFPSNLMVGFYAIADPDVPTRTDLDNELEGRYRYRPLLTYCSTD
ncbi:hypothetical protein NM688_g7700 [Phlebia brevispora]|uniref:Uncharacterized protein n=1 Tax=Phlebia brevispora TaxID=194682 RepID=A0ACC1S2C8_9APHY|nr:hypothetical protein NM688_g7700 [Phlebia brevispora]